MPFTTRHVCFDDNQKQRRNDMAKNKHEFPETITVVQEEEEYGRHKGRTLHIQNNDSLPYPNTTEVVATYKLVGIEKVTGKLVVTREQVGKAKKKK